MVEAGVLREQDRVELIDGVLVDVNPPGTDHSGAVAWLNQRLVPSVGSHEVRVQDLLLVDGGFVLPDLMVIDPLPRTRHPETAVLIVEVAVTTHRHDHWKAAKYALAAVDEYWLVDLPGRQVLVHRNPGEGVYREVTSLGESEHLEAHFGGPRLDVAELLGPAEEE